MYNHQASEFTSIAHQFAETTTFIRGLKDMLIDKYSSYRGKKASSKLSLHLQHDGGLIDIRPTREELIGDTMRFRQTTLEDLWLRYR